mmetsp:Transcript_4396/g.6588  ORF Transcript_4396/g.6588 Transcript_4396/m.6588 type:complete len:177 (-) Transcript_4396:128-658(-)
MCWERYHVVDQHHTLEEYEDVLRRTVLPASDNCCKSNEGLWGTVTRASGAGIVFLAHHTSANDWAVFGEATRNPTGGVRVEATVRPRTHVYIFMALWFIVTLGFLARFRSPVTMLMALVVIVTLAIVIKISQQGVRIYILQPLGIMAGPGSEHGLGVFMHEAKEYTPLVVPGAAMS